jgi:hypothetical protein
MSWSISTDSETIEDTQHGLVDNSVISFKLLISIPLTLFPHIYSPYSTSSP